MTEYILPSKCPHSNSNKNLQLKIVLKLKVQSKGLRPLETPSAQEPQVH